MRSLIFISSLASLLLYVAIIHRLFRAHLRTFFVLFAYLLVLLLTWVIDTTLYYGQGAIGFSDDARRLYFINDLCRQAMVYVLVISLIMRAVAGSARFRWMGRWLVLGAAVLAGLFFWFHHDPEKIATWMTNVIRNLSLVAMLMNLLLWILLVQRRTSDRTLLMVTSGLGLQMAGEAMGQSLRLIARATEPFGNVVLICAHIACLVVWYTAFKKPPQPAVQPR
jgi:hypothetical protein